MLKLLNPGVGLMSLTLTSFIATLFKWMPLVSTVHYFLRETPNPIPIRLGTMSHEQ